MIGGNNPPLLSPSSTLRTNLSAVVDSPFVPPIIPIFNWYQFTFLNALFAQQVFRVEKLFCFDLDRRFYGVRPFLLGCKSSEICRKKWRKPLNVKDRFAGLLPASRSFGSLIKFVVRSFGRRTVLLRHTVHGKGFKRFGHATFLKHWK